MRDERSGAEAELIRLLERLLLPVARDERLAASAHHRMVVELVRDVRAGFADATAPFPRNLQAYLVRAFVNRARRTGRGRPRRADTRQRKQLVVDVE